MGSKYKEMYRNHVWHVPHNYNFVWDVIDTKDISYQSKCAIITVHDTQEDASSSNSFTSTTYAELQRESRRVANLLLKCGVKKGDRILLLLTRVPEWYFFVLGAIRIGAVFVPTTVQSSVADIKYRTTLSEPVCIVTHLNLKENVDEALQYPNCSVKHKIFIDSLSTFPSSSSTTNVTSSSSSPSSSSSSVICSGSQGTSIPWFPYTKYRLSISDELERNKVEQTLAIDPMLIFFTSGTTGKAKMVVQRHSYAIGHFATAKYVQDLNPDDIHWTLADTGWAKTAWGKLFGQFIIGVTVVQFYQMSKKFDHKRIFEIIQRHKITTMCLPPTVYRLLLPEDFTKYNISSLRHCMSAGEPLNAEVISVWKAKTGLYIYDYYGQSETTLLISNFKGEVIKPGSMGLVAPGYHIELHDENDKRVPQGTEGQIAVWCGKNLNERPPGLFTEYWKNPKANSEIFRNGFYYTLDKAYQDEDGYFYFVGRADDVFKSNGIRNGPFEIESALIEHEAVLESAVIGVPDSVKTNEIKAFVVLKPNYKPSEELVIELQNHVKKSTAVYKYPRIIEFTKELPKTISGKIKRAELRSMELNKQKELQKQHKSNL